MSDNKSSIPVAKRNKTSNNCPVRGASPRKVCFFSLHICSRGTGFLVNFCSLSQEGNLYYDIIPGTILV